MKDTATKSAIENKTLYKLIGAACFVVIFHFVPILAIRILPASFWLEYEAVEPIKGRYVIGEDLIFTSTVNQKRPVTTKWSDRLTCTFEDGTFLVSIFNSGPVENWEANPQSNGWTYLEKTPSSEAICNLKSVITICPLDGICKSLDTITNQTPFEFVEE